MKHTLKRVLAMGTALVLTLGLSTAALAAEGEEPPSAPPPPPSRPSPFNWTART